MAERERERERATVERQGLEATGGYGENADK